jgi:phage/plasmid-like protein (TIGR03299 family)
MSKETYEWLNQNTLIGFTEKRGTAWHYRSTAQGEEPNHYVGAVPVEDVLRRLFHWHAVSVPLRGAFPADVETAEDVDHDGNPIRYIDLPEYQAIGRSDNGHIFKVFKDTYSIHQYAVWLLESLSKIIDDDLSIGSAGTLVNGGVAWVSIEMPDNIIVNDYEFRPQLLATTSHNGTIATTFKTVNTVVVCDNTLEIARGEKTNQFKARHSKHSGFRLATAREALQIIHKNTDDFVHEVQRLTDLVVTDRIWERLLNDLVPVPKEEDTSKAAVTRAENKQARLKSLWNEDPRVAPWKGTGLGVLQAFNTYSHHYAGTDERRVERNALGSLNGKIGQDDALVLERLEAIAF